MALGCLWSYYQHRVWILTNGGHCSLLNISGPPWRSVEDTCVKVLLLECPGNCFICDITVSHKYPFPQKNPYAAFLPMHKL